MVRVGILWSKVLYCGSSWYIVVRVDILLSELIYCGHNWNIPNKDGSHLASIAYLQ